MKGKRRGRTNPVYEYRRLQRMIREIFDPFTAKHCPTCVTPCCVKPTRVTPVDVALAIGLGHTFPHLGDRDPYEPAVADAGHRLSPEAVPLNVVTDAEIEFCEFLHRGRCTFPDDLRPYGCTTFICGPMYRHLPDDTIRRLRRLISQLDEAHVALIAALKESGRLPDTADSDAN